MSIDGEEVYGPDGEWLGVAFETEDGGQALVDADGDVVAAIDADNQPTDPSAYTFVGGEDEEAYDDPVAAELQQQLDRLEQRLEEPREVAYVASDGDAWDQERLHDFWRHQQGQLQTALGRSLTQAELARIAQHAAEAGSYDLVASAEQLASIGHGLRDVDHEHPGRAHEERVQHMAQLLDERSPDAPDPITGERPRQAEEYDRSTNAGRQAMIEDALAGHDVRGRDVDDSSYPTTDEDWQHDID